MYTYKSPVGTFWIKPDGKGNFVLGIENQELEVHYSPWVAADNVSIHVTGYPEWDKLGGIVSGPSDLSEWTKKNNPYSQRDH
ncbi:Hypothetical protein LUCI_2965 [Lucifera butyrica]|uniref:Uncharacterized protein n=1 Tax=Lucifera butyrica TaxID=1351585 RepID=A0A498R9S9_9FIRM|nr:hypothetical protein [Lucifera butyrica]VBB07700.1 Hypothetical protein LUCI_2965 [Lucifera butyrica]